MIHENNIKRGLRNLEEMNMDTKGKGSEGLTVTKILTLKTLERYNKSVTRILVP